MTNSSQIRSASLMISGLCIGGAMVGMPAALAPLGFWGSLVLLLACAIFMGLTAVLTSELAAYTDTGTHFLHMAKASLGVVGQWVVTFCYVVLLYALLAAYMSGLNDLIAESVQNYSSIVNSTFMTVCCVSMIALVIIMGVEQVAKANRWLMALLLIAFLVVVALWSGQTASTTVVDQEDFSLPFLNTALMIATTSFGYHILIPTLRGYLRGNHNVCIKACVYGSLMAFFVYLVWLLFVYHISDSSTLAAIRHGIMGPSQILTALGHHEMSSSSHLFGQIFLMMALLTSFVGVLISLQDFYLGSLPIRQSYLNRTLTMAVCLIVPAVFVLFYPHGFILALQYAGCMVLLLHGVFPSLGVLIIRRKKMDFDGLKLPNLVVVTLLLLSLLAIISWSYALVTS